MSDCDCDCDGDCNCDCDCVSCDNAPSCHHDDSGCCHCCGSGSNDLDLGNHAAVGSSSSGPHPQSSSSGFWNGNSTFWMCVNCCDDDEGGDIFTRQSSSAYNSDDKTSVDRTKMNAAIDAMVEDLRKQEKQLPSFEWKFRKGFERLQLDDLAMCRLYQTASVPQPTEITENSIPQQQQQQQQSGGIDDDDDVAADGVVVTAPTPKGVVYPALTVVNLNGHRFTSTAVATSIIPLVRNSFPNVETMILTNNSRLDREAGVAIAQWLSGSRHTNKKLSKLILTNNRLGFDGIAAIAQAIGGTGMVVDSAEPTALSCPSLGHLEIADCDSNQHEEQQGQCNIQRISGLVTCPTIRILELKGPFGWMNRALFRGLLGLLCHASPTLKQVSLLDILPQASGEKDGDDSLFTQLIEVLLCSGTQQRIEHLDIKMRLSDRACTDIGEALKGLRRPNATLHKLSLKRCGISDLGLARLASSLKCSEPPSSLTALDISYQSQVIQQKDAESPLQDLTTVKPLIDALALNRTLRHVDITGLPFSDEDASQLCSLLTASLEQKEQQQQLAAAAAAVPCSSSLCELRYTHHAISEHISNELQKLLMKNKERVQAALHRVGDGGVEGDNRRDALVKEEEKEKVKREEEVVGPPHAESSPPCRDDDVGDGDGGPSSPLDIDDVQFSSPEF